MRATQVLGTAKTILCCLVFCVLSFCVLAQQKTDKIQETIGYLKQIYRYRSQEQDYITDGKRTFWVKYYKTWTPQDLGTLKKENPSALQFLREASQHGRLDVLEQLLPDYYRSNGGVKAFSADIIRIDPGTQSSTILLQKITQRALCHHASFINTLFNYFS